MSISPIVLLRELAGSIEVSDSEDFDEVDYGDDDDDNDDNNNKSSTQKDDVDSQLDALLGVEVGPHKKWEKQKKLRRSTRQGDPEDEAIASAVRQRLKALPVTTCSICFEDESDTNRFISLDDCRHRFCGECLLAFSSNEVRDVSRVLHKRAALRQLAHNEFAIDFGWVATIRCPGAQCSGLIDVECMQQFAPADLIGIFQRFAVARRAQIDAAAELTRELARRNAQQIESANAEPRDPQGRLWSRSDGILHCARCREWAVEPAARGRLRCTACLQPYCSTCTKSHLRRYACDFTPKSTISASQAEKRFIALVTERTDGRLFRMCPRCDTLIEKNMGCDHHVCRACNHVYNWSQSPIPTLRNVSKWCKEIFFAENPEFANKKGKKR